MAGHPWARSKINESILVTQSQGGLNQGSYGGVGWLQLGSYSISSGTLDVMLSNKASGHFVDANGILIVPQGAGIVKSPISVPITSVPLGLTVTPTVGATTQSKTPSTTASATPATVVINGVSGAECRSRGLQPRHPGERHHDARQPDRRGPEPAR